MRFFKIVKQATKKNSKRKKSSNTKKGSKSKKNLKTKNKSKGKKKTNRKNKMNSKKKKRVYRGGNKGYSQYGSRPMHVSYGMAKDSGIGGNLANPAPYEITREFHP